MHGASSRPGVVGVLHLMCSRVCDQHDRGMVHYDPWECTHRSKFLCQRLTAHNPVANNGPITT